MLKGLGVCLGMCILFILFGGTGNESRRETEKDGQGGGVRDGQGGGVQTGQGRGV